MAKKIKEIKEPGRPTDYKSEYCVQIIEYGTSGKPILKFCADLGISRSTFYKWKDEYPEFKEASEIAKTKNASFWNDEMGKQGTSQDKYPNSAQLKAYVAANIDEYKTEVPNTNVTNNTLNISTMDFKDVLAKLSDPKILEVINKYKEEINIIDVRPIEG